MQPPYQVLSDFAQRIGGTYANEDVLPQMATVQREAPNRSWCGWGR
jgi:hypothetical protein